MAMQSEPVRPTLARSHYDGVPRGPLRGVRVLDLSRLVAGNMLTHVLADVVKVERPGAIHAPAPHFGEHTAEVLATIGLGSEAVAALRERGVV